MSDKMKREEKLTLVEKAWQGYINDGRISEKIRPEVKRSWQRCTHYRLNPLSERINPAPLRGNDLKERQDQYGQLIALITPVMEDLFRLVKGSGFIIILTDPEGYIIKSVGDPEFAPTAQKIELVDGANWQERVQGTNAIGTVLEERYPLTIYAREHLLKKNHILTCSATPLFDQQKRLLGVLDISGDYRAFHPHTLALIKQAGQQLSRNFDFPATSRGAPADRADYTFADIIGNSRNIKESIEIAKKIARHDSTVLIYGETGTGKELFAHAVHNYSSRCNQPFVPINCSAIPEQLLESELFGYETGAFTGSIRGGKRGRLELADRGTVFLDEISELSLPNQSRLLRVLEEKKITPLGSNQSKKLDLRFIVATNKSLFNLISKGEFRSDLYYRLNVVNLQLPTLRERKIDIIPLSQFFLQELGLLMNKASLRFDHKVQQALLNYHWPGNVRELKNVIEGALNLITGSVLKLQHLPAAIIEQISSIDPGSLPSLAEYEAKIIRETLELYNGNISQAAEQLAITRNTLYRKMKKYNL